MLQMFLGQLNDANAIASETIERLQQHDSDPLLLANALFVKAQTGYFLEDPALEETIAQAEKVLRSMGDDPVKRLLLAMILMLAAETESRKGNLEAVERLYSESEAIVESSNNAFLAWLEYSRLLVILQIDLETEMVRKQYEKVLDLLRQTRSSRVAAMAESDWGHRLRREGSYDEAMVIYRHMLVEWRELGHRAAMANILENMAFIDRVERRPERAATLLGAAERIREAIGQDMLRPEREEYEREVAELKRNLDPQKLDKLWSKGRGMSTDEMIDLALYEGEAIGG
jgi:tetratricopeptide (TPR) repeat protein